MSDAEDLAGAMCDWLNGLHLAATSRHSVSASTEATATFARALACEIDKRATAIAREAVEAHDVELRLRTDDNARLRAELDAVHATLDGLGVERDTTDDGDTPRAMTLTHRVLMYGGMRTIKGYEDGKKAGSAELERVTGELGTASAAKVPAA